MVAFLLLVVVIKCAFILYFGLHTQRKIHVRIFVGTTKSAIASFLFVSRFINNDAVFTGTTNLKFQQPCFVRYLLFHHRAIL